MALPPPSRRDWFLVVVLGLACGVMFLGIGGRLAMRGIALVEGRATGWSLGGSATVIFLGAVWGVVGALALMGLHALIRTHPVARSLLYWMILILLSVRGLEPVDLPRIVLFFPLVLGYGVLLQVGACRLLGRGHAASLADPLRAS